MLRDLQQSERELAEQDAAPVPELDLIHYHDGEGNNGRVVVEDLPPTYDMPKLRGLLDLAGEPPRRERAHKDATVARLAGARPPLDRLRFLAEASDVFAHFQVGRLTEKLVTLAHESGHEGRCTMRDFEEAVGKSGLLNKLTRRKMGRAFERIIKLDEEEHKNRERQRFTGANALHRGRSSKTLHVEGNAPSPTRRKKLQRAGNMGHTEMRRSLTHDLDEQPEEGSHGTTFHLLSWLRASECATVQLDCRIEAGEDCEWSMAIYDMLDTPWPWRPQEEGGPEEGVRDEDGHMFRGMLFGVTQRPVVMGPEVLGSTLTGIRARDGAIIHQGRLMDFNGELPRIDKFPGEPAIVTIRMDRRPYKDTSGYACRLWMQRDEDSQAFILVDDLQYGKDIDLYPCVYASRPETDIRHAVRLRSCGETGSRGMKASDFTVGHTWSVSKEKLVPDLPDVSLTSPSGRRASAPANPTGLTTQTAGFAKDMLSPIMSPKTPTLPFARSMSSKT